MKQVALNVKSRDALGSSAVKRLRDAGQIPAVIYGESGVRHLEVDAHAFWLAWRSIGGRAALLELHIDGDEESTFALIQDFQRDSVKDNFIHLDFKEVVRGKELETAIPVITKGLAYGVKNEQGVLELHAHELEVRCRPRDLPESIIVDVAALKVGDSLKLSDLPALENVTFIEDDDHVIVSCVGSSGGKSGAAEAEAEAEEAEAEAETASA
jgi:large subunit ribosomal protein L25